MQFKKILLRTFRDVFFNKKDIGKIVIIIGNSSADNDKFVEIKRRLFFFFGSGLVVERSENINLADKLNFKMIGYTGKKPDQLIYRIKYERVFNLDYETDPDEGWAYHKMLALIEKDELEGQRRKSAEKFDQVRIRLADKFHKSYIFGTGPSLEKAYDRNWSDGIRIVSNTIVKDKDLWAHINPHFIVAADAIYHFGIAEFAVAFRKDLIERLSETQTFFIFPERFFPFVRKVFSEFSDRLIPIPAYGEETFYNIIEKEFQLPAVGNVLNALLLPVACYLSDNVYLWGFDGRGPSDKLFWKNSDKQFYTDLVPQLQKLHPGFFHTYVPKDNPSKYVQSVHGDLLNKMLVEAENHGKTFHMMHESYTKTLMDRYDPSLK